MAACSEDAEPIRITTSGNSSLFHGVPDWVYEEEVLSSDYALWWSPDSSKVAFLRLDETRVAEYTFPVYNPSVDAYKVYPYTEAVAMKYPKPGSANPLVSVHVFDLARYEARTGDVLGFPIEDATRTLEWNGQQAANDRVVMEVAWVGNASLIVKEVNRAADDGSVVYFDLTQRDGSNRGHVVRKLGRNGEQGDDGWIDSVRLIFNSPSARTQRPIPYSESKHIHCASSAHWWRSGLPRHREQLRRVRPYRAVQPRQLEHPSICDVRRLGGHRRRSRRGC